MGQQEVYDFLNKNRSNWYTSKEITKALNISIGSVTMSLKKLRQSGILHYRYTGKIYEYRFKT
ncbi:MAG: ArsR family transcriptional regulator [Nanoarchaeota archaeon]|nr:ArsR family transcriptional regulator [Nanoarchaeota archaeon]MBU1704446.1 ArsR family transcriptional regulator [Nanoarchaeota archaeon]